MNARLFFRPRWLKRTVWTLTSVLVLVAGLILVSAIFSALLVVGLAAGGWLWWRLRRLAAQMRQATPEVLDGEYTVEPTSPLLEDHRASAPVTVQKTLPRSGR